MGLFRIACWTPLSKMKFTLLSAASIISTLGFLPSTHAWGQDGTFSPPLFYRPKGASTDQTDYPTGHAIVATIAEIYLDPTVLPTLCSILDEPGRSCSLASVASWADQIRNKMRWSAPLHYANAVADHPPQLCQFPGAKGWEGKKDINVLGGIRNTTNLLTRWVEEGSDPEDPVANEALKFLIHFAGDLHQPFHLVSRARGANDVYVRWGKKKARKYFRLELFVEHLGEI